MGQRIASVKDMSIQIAYRSQKEKRFSEKIIRLEQTKMSMGGSYALFIMLHQGRGINSVDLEL